MNDQGPVLSIILTSSNQLNHLKFTLLSLRDQAPDLEHEIIVVDCGSTDGSDQFLTAQAKSGAMAGNLRAILNTDSPCRTAARNQGAHLARGAFLMFLDPGMVVGPHWWDSLVRTLDRDPQVGAVAGKIILPDGRIDHAGLALLEWWDQSSLDRNYGDRLTGRSILAGKPADISRSNYPTKVQTLAGEALMVRATAFFSVGGFSARLGRSHRQVKPDFAGDLAGMDLSLRLGSRGWDCVYRHASVMTRLRLPETELPAEMMALGREQEIFDKTWLGRARGDFKIQGSRGTVPSENQLIQRYIEPVLAFGEPTALVPGKLARGNSSVVVVTGDNLENTRQCALSLLAHTEPGHELIFVDRESSDGTAGFLSEMASMHSQVRVIPAPKQATLTMGHNLGLAASRGRNIVLLSAAAVVTPGWLDILTTTADFQPRAGMVGPVTNFAAGLQQLGQVDYDTASLRGLNSYAAQMAARYGGQTDMALRLVNFCLLIKRELLARVGGLDPSFDRGAFVDNDFSLRAQLAGYHAVIARSCFVHCDLDRSRHEISQERLSEIEDQWQVFKVKWGIPLDRSMETPLDISALLAGGYQVSRHFQPLPDIKKAGVASTPAARTQAAGA